MDITVDDDDNYGEDNNNIGNLVPSIYCNIGLSDTEHYHTNNK